MPIAGDGYTFVRNAVDVTVVHALRAEADHLFRLKRAQDALSEDEYFEKGCALDFFTNNELPEDDEARVLMDTYICRRNGAHCARDEVKLSSACAEPPLETESRAASNALGGKKHQQYWSDKHVSVVRDAIFITLAGLAWDALKAACDTRRPDGVDPSAEGAGLDPLDVKRRSHLPSAMSAKHHGHNSAGFTRPARDADRRGAIDVDSLNYLGNKAVQGEDTTANMAEEAEAQPPTADGGPLLFNEQYVVKPPCSSIEFGWHTDEREQLAMCVFPPGVHAPVYVSVWLALDDCDARNGCLEVFPQNVSRARLQTPSDQDDAGVVCIPAKAGDAIVFLSNLWHRSGPNRTERPRRVFYAQYSCGVIRATPSDPRPLSLAVPCSLCGTADTARARKSSRPMFRSSDRPAAFGAVAVKALTDELLATVTAPRDEVDLSPRVQTEEQKRGRATGKDNKKRRRTPDS